VYFSQKNTSLTFLTHYLACFDLVQTMSTK